MVWDRTTMSALYPQQYREGVLNITWSRDSRQLLVSDLTGAVEMIQLPD